MNLNLSSAVKTTKSIITANSPVLLVGAAIAGVITTGVLAAKGGYNARGIVDAHRDESGEEPTPIEIAKLTWPCYTLPAITAASTVASVVGVHAIHSKRHAAMAALYTVTQGKLDDYTEKAEELLGPKKTQALNDATAQGVVDRDKAALLNHEVIAVNDGRDLCYDELAGRYFTGSVPVIEQAMASVNLQLAESGEASLNDFYDYVGLPPTTIGAQLGWQGKPGDRISARFGSVNTPDGRSAVSMSFREQPTFI